jgi:hypothetical protein
MAKISLWMAACIRELTLSEKIMATSIECVNKGVVLAELAGYSGSFCAKHGAGADIVTLGTYIIDSSENIPYPKDFVFKPGRCHYDNYFKEHVAIARGSRAKVCVSALSVSLQETIDAFLAAQQAGADYVSLCAYGDMEMFTSQGLSCEMARRHNWPKLREWIAAILAAVDIPLIFKFGIVDEPDTFETARLVGDMGVGIIHAVAQSSPESQALAILAAISKKCRFLIAGGGVKDVVSAERFFSAGVNAVSVARAAMKDATFITRLRSELVITI